MRAHIQADSFDAIASSPGKGRAAIIVTITSTTIVTIVIAIAIAVASTTTIASKVTGEGTAPLNRTRRTFL